MSENCRISKRIIRDWLDNYEAFILGDRHMDKLPGNSGATPYDGINAGRLNKIMLQVAIKELPPILKKVLVAKWIRPGGLNKTLNQLGLSKDQYYRRCEWVIDYLYYSMNNESRGKYRLSQKLNK